MNREQNILVYFRSDGCKSLEQAGISEGRAKQSRPKEPRKGTNGGWASRDHDDYSRRGKLGRFQGLLDFSCIAEDDEEHKKKKRKKRSNFWSGQRSELHPFHLQRVDSVSLTVRYQHSQRIAQRHNCV